MIGKHILALLAVLTVVIVKSQTNSLVIFSEKGNPFYLTLNKTPINKTEQSNVKAFDLSSGWQHIEIKTVISNTSLTLKDSILLSDKPKLLNKEFTYVLLLDEGKLKLEFKSASELSGPSKPPVPLAPKEVIPLEENTIYGNLYQVKNNKPVFINNFDKETSTCKNELTAKELKYAINLLNKSRDEESKLQQLNQLIDFNCYTANQLKQLLELLPIDMDRLNSAKQAYIHISDKQNINIILAAFKYQAMKESYASFLKDEENIIKQKNLKCAEPVNNTKFEEIADKIKNGGYENEKLILAKKLLVETCVSTVQVKVLALSFTHDRERLELFKWALNVLTDKENAKELGDEFQFNDTKTEFLKYISN